MVLKIYRGHDPGTILVILLTGFLVWLQPILNPVEVSAVYNSNPMPLYGLLRELFDGSLLAGTLLSFGLTLLTGFYLVSFNTRVFFINERTFLPAALFILLSGFFTPLQSLNPVYPSVLLIILAVDRVIGAYRKKGIAYNFFDASMMIGIASLFYFNSIWFFIGVIIGILLLRRVTFREIALAITGLITPYAVLFGWYYLAGIDMDTLVISIVANLTQVSTEFYWSTELIIVSAIAGLSLLISIFHLWSVFNTKKVRSRKTFSLLIWLLIISILLYAIVPAVSLEIFQIFIIPATYLLTHYLVFKSNKKIANAIFAIIFLLVLINQIV